MDLKGSDVRMYLFWGLDILPLFKSKEMQQAGSSNEGYGQNTFQAHFIYI